MSRHGENIRKRKDGRWEARYIAGRNSNGRALYKSLYAKSYFEVRQKREAAMKEMKEQPVLAVTQKTFKMVIEEFLDEHRLSVKPSTYVRYTEIAAKYLIPDFGERPIDNFTHEDGGNYIKALLENGKGNGLGLSFKRVKDIISLLKLVLKYAENKGYIRLAPVLPMISKQEHSQIQVFAPSQREQLETIVRSTSDSYKFGIYLCLYTGLRIGEICALQWKDVDCLNSAVSVNKTVLRIKNPLGNTAQKTQILIGSPKTPASRRIIPIPCRLNEMLKELKTAYSPTENSYVITCTEKLIEPRSYYRRYKSYLRLCNLENFNFHTLRHTFATRCIETGMDPKVLSEILGHSSVKITLDRYVHPSMEMKRNCIERLFAV